MSDINNPDMGHDANPSIAVSMKGYIIPVFFDLLFIISWIMIVLKKPGGSGGQGWCGMLAKILLIFQSFYGFLCMHSVAQPWAIVLMLFPAVGFIALSGGNKKWLLAYARPRDPEHPEHPVIPVPLLIPSSFLFCLLTCLPILFSCFPPVHDQPLHVQVQRPQG